MLKNINDYFENDYEFYLDKVDYTHKQKTSDTTEYSLNCYDKLETKELSENRLQVSVTRSLVFDPDDLYTLSVTYVVVLKFKSGKKDELKSLSNDLSKDLINYGQFFLSNIMARMSMLISEITASYGQPPVVTPPVMAPVK